MIMLPPNPPALQVAASEQVAYGQVPRTYFPMRQGNRVRLYHDAHQPVGPVPLPFCGGSFNEHSCWEDVHSSLQGAQRFIMITGWSVWTDTLLKRTPWNDCCTETLGQLLLKKAEEGVTVSGGGGMVGLNTCCISGSCWTMQLCCPVRAPASNSAQRPTPHGYACCACRHTGTVCMPAVGIQTVQTAAGHKQAVVTATCAGAPFHKVGILHSLTG
jgi:hypothetical protein